METKKYKVTAKAGKWVAGQRNPGADKVLELTEHQARYPLIAKDIEAVSTDIASAPALPPPADPAPVTKPPRK